jgi:diguanylate cyclase (GGDEF)-like protein
LGSSKWLRRDSESLFLREEYCVTLGFENRKLIGQHPQNKLWLKKGYLMADLPIDGLDGLNGIIVIDQDKLITQANSIAGDLFGQPVSSLLNTTFDIGCNIDHLLEGGQQHCEFIIPEKDDKNKIISASSLRMEWNNQLYFIISLCNKTKHLESTELLQYQSHHDHLTNLPNRSFFEKSIAEAIKEAKKSKQHMALLYLDIDNFKAVNDSLGHCIGDLLLQKISETLIGCTRQSDTVARLGGDEFAIILPNLRKPDYAATVAQKIIEKLTRSSFRLEENEVQAKISIGIAIYPYAGKKSSELLKSADKAMYLAKKEGKHRYHFFTEKLNNNASVEKL